MARKKYDGSTPVVVQRTVTVSTEWSLDELAEMTREPIDIVIFEFDNGRGQKWIQEHHLVEMTPEFDQYSTADGDALDVDTWAVLARQRKA
jgi:hypothetical protein